MRSADATTDMVYGIFKFQSKLFNKDVLQNISVMIKVNFSKSK